MFHVELSIKNQKRGRILHKIFPGKYFWTNMDEEIMKIAFKERLIKLMKFLLEQLLLEMERLFLRDII